MHIGQAIKNARKKRNMKQNKLALLVNSSQSHISLVEQGKKDPSLSLLREISFHLKTPIFVMYWDSIEEKDIDTKLGKQAFRIFKKPMDSMLHAIFG